jgi:hypothetical protein
MNGCLLWAGGSICRPPTAPGLLAAWRDCRFQGTASTLTSEEDGSINMAFEPVWEAGRKGRQIPLRQLSYAAVGFKPHAKVSILAYN